MSTAMNTAMNTATNTVMNTAVSASAGLRARLALTEPMVRAATAALWRPTGLGPRYATYLAVMHGVIRASVPLMERAATLCAALRPYDPVAAPLERYLRVHAEEERGHDDWLLTDLAALGDTAAALAGEQPPPSTARFVGAQYYWIEHHHPVALLGYIAVLESNAPAPRLADHLAASGVPEASLRTVRAHAELDDGHTADLFELLDALPLTPALRRAVTTSALHTVDGLIGLFARIAGEPRPIHRRPGGTHPS
ncbi:iron-containing redox enzyme family protein [Streptomyces sp. NPDC057620]|uniref:iron-containing redox enzyme family protein n=1 Tax=Streptomyces sp. NPDC057620 TaxID=3346185 RepID=UPI0036C83711